MTMHRGSADEHLRWITASRSQPSEEVAGLVSGMSDTEQDLACLHADAVAALFRVELKIGVCEQRARSDYKVSKMQETVAKREEQSAIFGVRKRGRSKRGMNERIGGLETERPPVEPPYYCSADPHPVHPPSFRRRGP